MNVTKHQICNKIAEKHGMRASLVKVVADELFRGIADAFSVGKELEIRGFGVFRLSRRSSRVAHDIRRGAAGGTRDHTYISIRFKPGRGLKKRLVSLEAKLKERLAPEDEPKSGDA